MDLTKDPIPGLIKKIAVPASVGFFFNTMYNVVDTYFAGLISTDALAALSLSFPIFFIIIAFGSGLSQGATALIANALGEKNNGKTHHIAMQAISFSILFSVCLTFLGLMFASDLFRLLGASDNYLGISLAYMNVLLMGTGFFILQSVINSALNAQGDTKSYRNVLILGFLLNLVLDPWFLFGGFGLPAMGVRGIALATVLIQALGCVFLAVRLTHSRIWMGFSGSDLWPERKTFKEIAVQGFPAGFNMATVAIGIFVITLFVSRFSMEGVAAYGIATRIEQIVLLPTIGLNIAVLSLTGQNNGAKRLDRVSKAYRTTLTYGLIMMVIGGTMIYVFARPLMAFFTEDQTVVRIGVEYLHIASITLCSYVILFQTVFLLQGLKKPMYAIFIGIYRQIVAPVIVFYFLAYFLDWKLDGIWWGVFGVTWSAALITLFYGRYVLHRLTEESGSN